MQLVLMLSDCAVVKVNRGLPVLGQVEGLGVGPVGDLGLQLLELEHRLHVDQRLAHLWGHKRVMMGSCYG